MSLLREVGFDQAFTYSYSKREQTYAGLFMQDDVEESTKGRRLQELVDVFQSLAVARNRYSMIFIHGILPFVFV